MRFFIFEQAGDACAGPCRELVIILFSTPVNNTKGTGANYVRRPLIHDAGVDPEEQRVLRNHCNEWTGPVGLRESARSGEIIAVRKFEAVSNLS